jgi:hypothetical protein
MKTILLLIPFASLSLLNVQCKKEQKEVPQCVWNKIDAIKAEPKWNPPAEVIEYLYNGKQVYLFTSDCCDQYIMLYDGSCNYICAPSGGITGSGDGKCTDFYSTAKHVKLVWKDPR